MNYPYSTSNFTSRETRTQPCRICQAEGQECGFCAADRINRERRARTASPSPSPSEPGTIPIRAVLHPNWDREADFRSHMRARMESRLQPAMPGDRPRCLHCRRELAPNETATCQHCDLQWRALRRSQARADRWRRTGWIVIYIGAAIGLAIILGELVSGGCR